MRRVKGQNKTFRQLYTEIEQQTGLRARDLDGPALPDAGIRLWCWFQDLSRRRACHIVLGGGAPQPIPYSEVRAYFDLAGERIDPWQRRLLTDLDDLYLAIATQETEPGRAIRGVNTHPRNLRAF